MNIVPDFIAPIRLLKGHHSDTGATGQGCFMDVIAYLNGEPQITDQSPCVCTTVRPIAIRLNDDGSDEQRQRLLPFVMRAMGSATKDRAVMDMRMARLRQYGAECQEILNNAKAALKKFPADAYAYADASAYASAYAYADAYDDASAYASAYAYAYAYADADAKKQIRAIADGVKADLYGAGLRYLDDVLPPADVPTSAILERAERLCELAR